MNWNSDKINTIQTVLNLADQLWVTQAHDGALPNRTRQIYTLLKETEKHLQQLIEEIKYEL